MLIEELGGDAGNERTGSGRAATVECLGGEHFAGTLFALYIDEAKMGCSASHASKELLHDEAAAGHGAQHPSFRVENIGLEGFEVETAGNQQRLFVLLVGIG